MQHLCGTLGTEGLPYPELSRQFWAAQEQRGCRCPPADEGSAVCRGQRGCQFSNGFLSRMKSSPITAGLGSHFFPSLLFRAAQSALEFINW